MTIAAPPSGLQPEDYEEIEAVVMETARGRWFLSEYARRQRGVEMAGLRAALTRVEERLDALGAQPCPEAAPIVERLSDLAWTLRESGVEDYVCAKIEGLAREIAAQPLDKASAPAAETPADSRRAALLWLDRLPLVDRMALLR